MDNEIRFETMVITPEQSRIWLAGRGNNRKINERRVAEYANQMKSGQWRYTHQGIAFDQEGRLIDGQHRLSAVIEAGKAITMVVAKDVPRGNFLIIDRGYQRSMDVITGIPAWFNEVYIFMIMMISGRRARPNPDDVKTLHQSFKDLNEDLKIVADTHAKFLSTVPIRSAAVVAMAAAGQDKEYVLATYRDFVNREQTMPAAAWALVKFYDNAKTTTAGRYALAGQDGRIDFYFKARYMFTPDKADSRQVRVSEELKGKYTQELRNLVKAALMKSSSHENNDLLKKIMSGKNEKAVNELRN